MPAPHSPTQRSHDQLFIMNTDLRDGRQAPGNKMIPKGTEDLSRIEDIAQKSNDARMDTLEVSVPIRQPIEHEITKVVAQNTTTPVISVFTLLGNDEKDNQASIESSSAALAAADLFRQNRARFSLLVSTAPKLRKSSLGNISLDDLERRARFSGEAIIKEFIKHGADPSIHFYLEGATQTERPVLYRMINAFLESTYEFADKEGIKPEDIAMFCSLPDTLGVHILDEYGQLFADVRENVSLINEYDVIMSAHTHGDVKHDVSNALFALENGAMQAEGTTRGIGERNGNMNLSAFLMTLHGRQDRFGHFKHNVNLMAMAELARSVSRGVGRAIAPEEPVHGDNSNETGAGIHQKAVADDPTSYNFWPSQDFGEKPRYFKFTNQSGKHAVNRVLADRNIILHEDVISMIVERMKSEVNTDMAPLEFLREYVATPENAKLFELQAIENGGIRITDKNFHSVSSDGVALVELSLNHGDETTDTFEGESDKGTVDAAKRAIQNITGLEIRIDEYDLKVDSEGGSDSEVVVSLDVHVGNQMARGFGADTDQDLAAAKAIANGLNNIEL